MTEQLQVEAPSQIAISSEFPAPSKELELIDIPLHSEQQNKFQQSRPWAQKSIQAPPNRISQKAYKGVPIKRDTSSKTPYERYSQKQKKTNVMESTKQKPFVPKKIEGRRKPGVLALQEIKYLQRNTGTIIPKASFGRVVKEVLHRISDDLRIQSNAVLALHEASEAMLTGLMESANHCTVHAKRITLQPKDLKLALRIGGYKFN